jgi:hypothetical protein
MHIAEVIRGWLGWCPNRQVTTGTVRSGMPGYEMRFCRGPGSAEWVMNKRIVDYGSTGTSPIFFIGFFVGIAGVVLLLSLIRIASSLLAGTLLCGLILSVAIILFYQDVNRASLESTPDSLIIHKVLPWPVVIPKSTISAVEVRENVLPVPIGILALLLLVAMPVASAGVLYGEYLQFVSGATSSSFFVNLGFDLGIVLFFIAIYYHSRVRSYYPTILVITTTTKKRVGVYIGNMDEMRGKLERPV